MDQINIQLILFYIKNSVIKRGKKMQKADIEQLWDLEVTKSKRIFQTPVSNDEVYITALDYSDEIIILRSKIESISETGIIIIVNPDRAARDGELYQLVALNALKLVVFTHKSVSEADIEDQLDIAEEDEAEEEEGAEEDTEEYIED
jgi:hypothetical protein